MEEKINERLVHYLETEGKLKCYQSGFRKGRGTIDPALCLQHEIQKANVNKESVVTTFISYSISKRHMT